MSYESGQTNKQTNRHIQPNTAHSCSAYLCKSIVDSWERVRELRVKQKCRASECPAVIVFSHLPTVLYSVTRVDVVLYITCSCYV